jgi:F-type H+-transporting ATPase subunit epsilon
VTTADGEKVKVDAEGGFLSVDHDTVTIVAGRAALV